METFIGGGCLVELFQEAIQMRIGLLNFLLLGLNSLSLIFRLLCERFMTPKQAICAVEELCSQIITR